MHIYLVNTTLEAAQKSVFLAHRRARMLSQDLFIYLNWSYY